jgi:IS1 family transposase
MLLKEQLSQILEEKEKIIKVQIEEAEVTHELIERQLKEKDQRCERIEAQNSSLRKELEEAKK